MPLDVSRETMDRWERYRALLHKWQESVNLVSRTTLQEADTRHFEDSCQVLDLIPANSRVVDIGSGAGFPGMVIATARPDCDVTLIESDKKKCAFLRAVSRETKTSVTILDQRIEHTAAGGIAADVVTARALAPLVALLDYASLFKEESPALRLIALKGEGWAEEVREARQRYDFTFDQRPSVTGDGVVLWVDSFSPRA